MERLDNALKVYDVVDLNNEWLNVTTTSVAQGCLICKASYAEENEDIIVFFNEVCLFFPFSFRAM